MNWRIKQTLTNSNIKPPITIRWIPTTNKPPRTRTHTNWKTIQAALKNQTTQDHLFMANQHPNHKGYRHIYIDIDHPTQHKKTLETTLLVQEHLKTYNIETIIISTGSKGYHTHIPLPQGHHKNLQGLSKTIQNQIQSGAELIDTATGKESLRGVERLPYSINPNSGERSYILNPKNPEESIEEYKAGRIPTPKINPEKFKNNTENLQRYIEKHPLPKETQTTPKKVTMKCEWFRELVRRFMQPIYGTTRYDMYLCPLQGHKDENPSFVVWDDGWMCFGCQRGGAPLDLFRVLLQDGDVMVVERMKKVIEEVKNGEK